MWVTVLIQFGGHHVVAKVATSRVVLNVHINGIPLIHIYQQTDIFHFDDIRLQSTHFFTNGRNVNKKTLTEMEIPLAGSLVFYYYFYSLTYTSQLFISLD